MPSAWHTPWADGGREEWGAASGQSGSGLAASGGSRSPLGFPLSHVRVLALPRCVERHQGTLAMSQGCGWELGPWGWLDTLSWEEECTKARGQA